MQVQDDPGQGSDLDLRHYLQVIGRRKWVIIAVALVVGLAAMGFAFTKDDRYRATGRMLLLTPGSVEAEAEGFSTEPDRAIANEIEILGSLEMREAVTAELGEDAVGVDASSTGENDVIVLSAESTDPAAAAAAVNAYARTYERIRRQRTVEALRVQAQDLQSQRRDQVEALAQITAPLDDLNQQIQATPPGPDQDVLIAQRSAVEQNIAGAREGALSRIGQLEADTQSTQRAMRSPTGGVNFLNPATEPSEPVYPQPKKDLLVGLIVGLLLGLAAAFVWEQLDDAVRGRADADRATGGIAVVGVVPRVAGWRNRADPRLVVRDEPHSTAAEAYRSLVTSLEFLSASGQDGSQVLLFTSPGASEGKTTTVANVGRALAESGHRTVIIDGDLRRPRLHRFFGFDNTVGLTTVLSDRIDIATAVIDVDASRQLSIVPAGPIPPNPPELLRSEVMEAAVTKLREAFDIVLIDSPPVLPVADALVLARHADATILLVAAGTTSRRKLSRAVEALTQVDAPLQGLVLNGVGSGEGYEYGYYGGDYTGDDIGEPKRRRRRRRSADA